MYFFYHPKFIPTFSLQLLQGYLEVTSGMEREKGSMSDIYSRQKAEGRWEGG